MCGLPGEACAAFLLARIAWAPDSNADSCRAPAKLERASPAAHLPLFAFPVCYPAWLMLTQAQWPRCAARCWDKLCRYFEIEARKVPVEEGRYVATPELMRPLIDENTIGGLGAALSIDACPPPQALPLQSFSSS